MNFIAEVRFFFSTAIRGTAVCGYTVGLVFFSPRVCSLDRVSEDLIGEVILT